MRDASSRAARVSRRGRPDNARLRSGRPRRLWSWAFGLFVVIGGCSHGGPRGPAVILILIDTLRADHVGVLGAGPARTPVLDRLAAEGILFRRCRAQVPLTLPSTSTLLASQWPNVHRVRENYDERLSDRAETLAEVLSAAGFATAAFVSALPVRKETGLAQGFDVYDDDFSEPFVFNDERFVPLGDRWTGSERNGARTIERAVRWLDRRDGAYFLFVHLFEPHSPYDPPPPYDEGYPSAYAGEVAYADTLVGRLLAAAREGGRAPLVTVVSDHGEGLGDHGEFAHGIFLYDATLHVPWILARPGVLEPAVVEPDVRVLDVAPTILDALGMTPPPAWAGESALPLARGLEEPARAIYAENHFTRTEYGWSALTAWTERRWKWIRAPRSELYDLREDPGERHDLSSARADTARALAEALAGFEASSVARARSHGTDGLVEAIDPEPRVREWLGNLGYLTGGGEPEGGGPLPDPKDRIDEWNARNEAKVHTSRGEALLEAGDAGVAAVAFETSLALIETIDARRGLALALLALGRSEAARPHIALALATTPNDADLLLPYARILSESGETARADTVLTRAVLVDSTRAAAFAARGAVRARLGQTLAAIDDLERALVLAPGDAAVLERLAGLSAESGAHDRAVRHYEALLTAREWDPIVHWRLGLAARNAGDRSRALEAFRRARAGVSRGALRDSIDRALASLGE